MCLNYCILHLHLQCYIELVTKKKVSGMLYRVRLETYRMCPCMCVINLLVPTVYVHPID